MKSSYNLAAFIIGIYLLYFIEKYKDEIIKGRTLNIMQGIY